MGGYLREGGGCHGRVGGDLAGDCVETEFLHVSSDDVEAARHSALRAHSGHFSAFRVGHHFRVNELRTSPQNPPEKHEKITTKVNLQTGCYDL